jgi:hypothetical protein
MWGSLGRRVIPAVRQPGAAERGGCGRDLRWGGPAAGTCWDWWLRRPAGVLQAARGRPVPHPSGHGCAAGSPSAQLTDRAPAAEVTRKARRADGTLDPDEWFPVSTKRTQPAARRPGPSPSARPVPCAARAWSCRRGTGPSASTASGAASSRPTGPHCAADGSPPRTNTAAPCPSSIASGTDPGNQSRRANGPACHDGRHVAPPLVPHPSSQDGPRDAQTPDSGGAPRS